MKKQLKLSDYKVQKDIEVQWGDMDAAQHVNNVKYMRWGETARINYFDEMGCDVTPAGNDAGFILGWQDCKYIFPVTYPDTIRIGVRVTDIGEDRFSMECAMFSEKHERLVALAKQVVVTYDYVNLKKVPVSEKIKHAIEKLEGKEF